MSTLPTLPTGLADVRAKIETKLAEVRTRANERLTTMGLALRLPLFPRPTNGNETPATQRLRRQSQLAPFNVAGIASNIRGFRGQGMVRNLLQRRRIRPQTRGQKNMHPGIVDTATAAVERAKGAYPVSSSISVEM